MKAQNFDNLNENELVKAFAEWAEAAGEATLDGNRSKMRQAAYRLRDLDYAFQARGPKVRSLLIPLLGHPKPSVRYHVAHHLLAIVPEHARAVIEQVAAGIGPIAGAAGMTLHALDTGVFKPD